MIDKAISPASIQSMLQTLRSHQSEASGKTAGMPGATELGGVQNGATGGVQKTGFSDLVSGALGQVNDLQVQSSDMRAAFDRGENMQLTDVVLGMQKSSLAFEATLQVRNKVLKAYEEILNMPV
ncbi:flagellar hook-basal body complex protein FliE [Limnohabitans sp. 15K]|uniref:flagellar hook-basal body complex protein FliE n=1 Tax=Limnohabitans sp. 15K TaxID=1100706 RepID=UPI000C1F2F85|nr:flagellar hook-basal body complex protein FliE [Limnohabitans sp. 15K]PIT82084.1 flagellar hook-basal body complex protein FliE [Limnohabitans sp. 15K]